MDPVACSPAHGRREFYFKARGIIDLRLVPDADKHGVLLVRIDVNAQFVGLGKRHHGKRGGLLRRRALKQRSGDSRLADDVGTVE